MPWQCNQCSTTIQDHELACPGCQAPKTSWTLLPDATRTFVMAPRKVELLRAEKRAKEVPSLTKAAVAERKGKVPADQVLTVRLHPRDHADLTITLGIGFASAELEERAVPVERPSDLAPDGVVDVRFLFVHGEGAIPKGPAGVRVVEVGEQTESGYAPQVEVAALGRRPKEVPVVAATDPKRAQLLEVEDAQFHSGSAVLLPVNSEGGRDRVDGLGVLAKTLEHAAAHPDLTLLITGHTDTTGSMDSNVSLSELRAKSVRAALTGDRAGWVAVADERDKPEDHQLILTWIDRELGWDCNPGPVDGKPGPKTRAGVEAFQARYNREQPAEISVDGAVGPQTLGAIFDVYERVLAKELGVDVAGLAEKRAALTFLEPGAVGCGEYHPVENERENDYRSAANRRVELLFFAPDAKPDLACHQGGGCNPEACPVYDYTAYYTEHIPVQPSASPPSWLTGPVEPSDYFLRALLYVGDLQRTVPDTEFVAQGPLEDPENAQEIRGTTDEDGLAASPSLVHAGVYEIRADGKTGRAAAVPYEQARYPVWMELPQATPLEGEPGEDDLSDPDAGEEDDA